MLVAAAAVVLSGSLGPAVAASASARPTAAPGQPGTAKTATLTVAVTDLPARTAGSVRVTGPGGYSRNLQATTRLAGLAPGKYEVTANPVTVKGTTYAPTVANADLKLAAGGKATSTAAYFMRIPATTVPLAASAVKSVSVKGNTAVIALAQAASVKAGDIIAVDAGSQTPDGLLAKVVAVKDEVVTATLATLQQAFPQGDFATSDTFQLTGTLTATVCGGVTVKVSRSLTVREGLAAKWGGSGGTEVDADVTVSGSIGIAATLAAGKACHVSVPLGRKILLKAVRIKIPKQLKIVTLPELGFSLKGAVQSDTAQTMSGTLTLSGTAGIDYSDGHTTVEDGLKATAAYQRPEVDGTGSIELTPSVDASIDLYKKASASVNVDAGLRLDKAKNGLPAWALDGILRAGGSLSFGKASWSNEAAIDKSFPIAHPDAFVEGSGLGSVACPSATVCEATGEDLGGATAILRSTDGGEVWVPQALPKGTDEGIQIACPTTERCYAATDVNLFSAILETSNGGATWTVAYTPPHGSVLYSIACSSAEHCVAAGDNDVAVTTDGGAVWASWTPPTTLEPLKVACPSAVDCFATAFDVTPDGEYADVMRSTNGGHNWASTRIGFQGALQAISCPSTDRCVAVGDDDNGNGYVARTVNGADWSYGRFSAQDNPAVTGVSCPTKEVCVAVGSGTEPPIIGAAVIRSDNGAESWTSDPVPNGAAGLPWAIACHSASECELVGGYQPVPDKPEYASAASTDDTGGKWSIQLP